MNYVSRPKSAAATILMSILPIFWVRNIDIGYGDIDPPLTHIIFTVAIECLVCESGFE